MSAAWTTAPGPLLACQEAGTEGRGGGLEIETHDSQLLFATYAMRIPCRAAAQFPEHARRWLTGLLTTINNASCGVRTHAQLPAVDLKSTPLTTRANLLSASVARRCQTSRPRTPLANRDRSLARTSGKGSSGASWDNGTQTLKRLPQVFVLVCLACCVHFCEDILCLGRRARPC